MKIPNLVTRIKLEFCYYYRVAGVRFLKIRYNIFVFVVSSRVGNSPMMAVAYARKNLHWFNVWQWQAIGGPGEEITISAFFKNENF